MSELFLIAHKVRGEPAFDIAERIECPSCKEESGDVPGCVECGELGYWWIIPTSGHRAYPYWWTTLSLLSLLDEDRGNTIALENYPLPENLPDHYPANISKPAKETGPSLFSRLALHLPKAPPIKRRV